MGSRHTGPHTEGATTETSLRDARILVASGDAGQREALLELLQRAGCRQVTALADADATEQAVRDGAWQALVMEKSASRRAAGLAASEERYALAAAAANDALFDWDLDTDTIYFSDRWRAMLGLTASEIGDGLAAWLARAHPDDQIWLRATLEGQSGQGGRPFQIEYRVAASTGEYRWIACRGIAVLDDCGEPRRIVGSQSDITDRKRAETALRESEDRYALAVAAANDALYDWDIPAGTIYFADRWLGFLGLTRQELGTSPADWFARVHPDDLIWLQATLEAQGGKEGRPFQIEYRVANAAGDYLWIACRGIAVVNAQGEAIRIVGSQSDITERKRAEQELKESEERYALAAQGANDGLFDWRIDRNVAYFSDRWRAILGWEPDQDSSINDWLEAVAAEDRAALDAAIAAHISGTSDHLESEFRLLRADGAERWLVVRGLAVRNGDEAVRLVGSVRDITARKRLQIELSHRALHDELTELPNRALFLDRLGSLIARRTNDPKMGFVVAVVAIDRFEAISDGYGPLVGDQVLVEVARRLQRGYRQGDTIARVGDDQFGLLLDGVQDHDVAAREAARINGVLAEPVRIGQHELILTASIGIVTADPERKRSPEEMLRDASLAVFRAKSAGRGQLAVFDSALHERAMRALELESALRGAVDRNELCMFYQPMIDLESGRLAGFEALMRWRRPGHGLVSPVHFIPVAEESGLIVPMGRRGLLDAVAQLEQWSVGRSEADSLLMSVNVSARQFRDDDVVALVREVLAAHPIDPTWLKLEVTESVLMDEPGKLARTLGALRDLGVKISLDDFGTGYSSLSYLHQFPFDVLKIDRAFIRGVAGRQAEIARAIGLLGRSLSLDVVAEGIEDENDAAFARTLGSHFGQGWLYGKPMPAEECGPFFKA